MGGEHDRLTAAEAASVLGWWIEAGVDVAIQEKPRAWLGEAATPAPSAPMAIADPEPTHDIPTSLDAFRGWLGGELCRRVGQRDRAYKVSCETDKRTHALAGLSAWHRRFESRCEMPASACG
jgi:hypothetical protein